MAGAVETARPVAAEIRAGHLEGIVRLERAERRAAQVRAHREAHPVLRIARARRAAGLDVVGLLESSDLGSASMSSWPPSSSTICLARRTTNTACPRHTTFSICPGFELRRIDLDRRTQRLGARARLPRGEKRNRRKRDADGAGAGGGRRQQAAAAVVNLITHSFVLRELLTNLHANP